MFCLCTTEIVTFSTFDISFFATHTMQKVTNFRFWYSMPYFQSHFCQSVRIGLCCSNNSQSQCLEAIKVHLLLCYMTIVRWLGVRRGSVQHFPSLQTQAGAGSSSLLPLCAEDFICFISFNPHSYYSCFSEEGSEA